MIRTFADMVGTPVGEASPLRRGCCATYNRHRTVPLPRRGGGHSLCRQGQLLGQHTLCGGIGAALLVPSEAVRREHYANECKRRIVREHNDGRLFVRNPDSVGKRCRRSLRPRIAVGPKRELIPALADCCAPTVSHNIESIALSPRVGVRLGHTLCNDHNVRPIAHWLYSGGRPHCEPWCFEKQKSSTDFQSDCRSYPYLCDGQPLSDSIAVSGAAPSRSDAQTSSREDGIPCRIAGHTHEDQSACSYVIPPVQYNTCGVELQAGGVS